QHVTTFTRLAQFEHGAARYHFTTMREETFKHLFQVQQLGLTINQRHHVHAEGVLQLRLLEQIIQYNFRYFVALELNHYTHTGFIGLIPDVRNTVEFLVTYQFGNTFQQRLLVNLIGQFIDDDGRAAFLAEFLEVRLGAHDHATATSAIAVAHARHAINDAAGRKIRRRNDLYQLIHRTLLVVQHMQCTVDDLGDVVRRNIGRHTDRNT